VILDCSRRAGLKHHREPGACWIGVNAARQV
jgi:hypothetical protein